MAAEFPVVFALYPRVTQLDFTGPLEGFARLPAARRGCSAGAVRRATGRFVSCCHCSARSPIPAAWCVTATCSPVAA